VQVCLNKKAAPSLGAALATHIKLFRLPFRFLMPLLDY